MNWKRICVVVGVADLLALNAWVGYGWYKQFYNRERSQSATQLRNPDEINDICGNQCQRAINARIEALKIELANLAGPSAEPKITIEPATAKPTVVLRPTKNISKTQTVTYMAIPGNGNSIKNDWENLGGTEFYFNPKDYPGLKEVYFEANIRLYNGNGMAFVRLFDETHGIGVQGSDVQTNSQSNTIVVSGRVSFWAGNNLIKVQAKTLTADTVMFNSGRLKIIQEI